MRLKAAIEGDLRKVIAQEIRDAKRAITLGLKDTARDLQRDLRGQTRRAGLGRGLTKAWRVVHYPKGRDSMNAAAVVYSKAQRIHAAFELGPTVRPKKGKWLVIPMPIAKKRGWHKSFFQSKGSRERNWSNVWAAHHQFGGLRFVQVSPTKAYLFADDATKTGLKRKRKSKAPRKYAVPLFLLVKKTKVPKRLSIETSSRKAGDRAVSNMLRVWKRKYGR